MLRTLIWQLTCQLSDGQNELERLYSSYNAGPPPAAALSEQLLRYIQPFTNVYILIDGLDDSPRLRRRDDVLKTIKTMRDWSMRGLHLFVTSRSEVDIYVCLDVASEKTVTIETKISNEDISNLIAPKSSTESILRTRWYAYHDRAKNLSSGEHKACKSMVERLEKLLIYSRFRWADLQLHALWRCRPSNQGLERFPDSLPQDLDEAYERVLLSIEDEHRKVIRRILTLLCFSSRPLRLSKLLHGLTMDLDQNRLLKGIDYLREISSELIDFGLEAGEDTGSTAQVTTGSAANSIIQEMSFRIAHSSVQKHLESDRIRQQNAKFFAISRISAHQEIAMICCAYLLELQISPGLVTQGMLAGFPLAHLAAQFWYYHDQADKEAPKKLRELINRLSTQQHDDSAT